MSDTPPLPRPAATSGDSLSGFFYALAAYLLWGFLPLYMKALAAYAGARSGGASGDLVGSGGAGGPVVAGADGRSEGGAEIAPDAGRWAAMTAALIS
jgi:hypothetical protein